MVDPKKEKIETAKYYSSIKNIALQIENKERSPSDPYLREELAALHGLAKNRYAGKVPDVDFLKYLYDGAPEGPKAGQGFKKTTEKLTDLVESTLDETIKDIDEKKLWQLVKQIPAPKNMTDDYKKIARIALIEGMNEEAKKGNIKAMRKVLEVVYADTIDSAYWTAGSINENVEALYEGEYTQKKVSEFIEKEKKDLGKEKLQDYVKQSITKENKALIYPTMGESAYADK